MAASSTIAGAERLISQHGPDAAAMAFRYATNARSTDDDLMVAWWVSVAAEIMRMQRIIPGL